MEKLYVIRIKNREESAPLTIDQVRELIKSGKLKTNDEISIYPNKFSIQAKDYPEFEDLFVDRDKTSVIDVGKLKESTSSEKTRIFDLKNLETENEQSVPALQESADIHPGLKEEKTSFIELPESQKDKTGKASKGKIKKRSFGLLAALCIFLFMYMEEEEEEEIEAAKNQKIVMVPVRPKLPAASSLEIDPSKSEKIFQEGLKHYFEDTVIGYRRASVIFHKSLAYDPQNVTALSILASSYLNLIESSNQDEKTFSVISKLIDLSKVKDATTVETLIAEVEFLAVSRRYDAGIQRLVEYLNVTGKIDPSLYYYISWLYHLKGENANALKYLNLIPASALPVPKLYFLRGLIHEENQEYDDAYAEYGRALKLSPKHAKSILGMVRVDEKRGRLKNSLKKIRFLSDNISLQSPKEYIETLVLRSKVALVYQEPQEAISSLKKALQLDPKNESLRLDYYSLLSQLNKDKRYSEIARMYSMILEGDRLIKEQKIHEATAVLIQSKDEFPKSEIPSEKMGDLFYKLGEFYKAATNYKAALKINSNAEHVAIKLIDSSIKGHDWDEATKLLAKYRSRPKLKSAIDRLAGDLEVQQGNNQRAIQLYLKAMARDSIDTDVYTSYANILRESDRCKDAQFFYSVAQKFDPLNIEAIHGTAKCILKADGAQAAVSRIQDELVRLPKARADYLAAIADIQLMAGDSEKAILFADQAIELDPNYAESYRIKANAYSSQMHVQKESKKKALDAFLAYSEKKPSDPSGFLNRFEIFLKESNFNQAEEELSRVFDVSPRFPELHYKRALLFSKMGKIKDALSELDEELSVNPRMIKALDERGNILLKQNQLDEAMKSFVKSMELEPRNAASKLGAGQVNYLKRQFSAAIALYQSALALDKGNPEIHKKLGQAFRDSGDLDRAKQYFNNYLDLDPNAPDHEEYEKYR